MIPAVASRTEVELLEQDLASAIARTLDGAGLGGDIELARTLGEAVGIVLVEWGIWATSEGTLVMERPREPLDE